MKSDLLLTATIFLIMAVGLLVVVLPFQIDKLKKNVDNIVLDTDRLKEMIFEVKQSRLQLRKANTSFLKSFYHSLKRLFKVKLY